MLMSKTLKRLMFRIHQRLRKWLGKPSVDVTALPPSLRHYVYPDDCN